MRKTLLASAAVFAVATVAADAQDQSWNGRYFGVHAGHSGSDFNWVDNTGGWYTFAPGNSYSVEDTGLAVGAQLGVRKHLRNNIVGGLEFAFSGLDHRTSVVSPLFPASDTWQTNIGEMVTATARVGVATGMWLPYLEGGLAAANVGITNIDSVNGACAGGGCVFSSSEWQTGYTVGIGVDYRVSDRMTMGLNYKFADFGDATHAGVPTNRIAPENFTAQAKLSVLTFRLNWTLD